MKVRQKEARKPIVKVKEVGLYSLFLIVKSASCAHGMSSQLSLTLFTVQPLLYIQRTACLVCSQQSLLW